MSIEQTYLRFNNLIILSEHKPIDTLFMRRSFENKTQAPIQQKNKCANVNTKIAAPYLTETPEGDPNKSGEIK